ncbi:MAG: DNA-directed RNA polymerase subunit H [Candidatus Bathyarchaeota archaeon]|nr:MAG: DNA-directed RNA polymerase subunit H [Candidatus Bathyarchaeota archaeon]
MKEIEVEKGIIVANGRYTQACRKRAVEKGIELIPQIFPAFNIFKHTLVPKHEIITSEEKEELLTKYGIQPYQLPRIRVSDPGAIAIGASPGDIIRIIRKSPTAGEYVGYRYVVED